MGYIHGRNYSSGSRSRTGTADDNDSTDAGFWMFIAFMGIFCIAANLLTLIVIARKRSLYTKPFNVVLMSLCVSDLLSAIISPLIYYRSPVRGRRNYDLPEFVCKISITVDHWTTIATMLHILSFIIMRLVAVAKPYHFKKFTAKHAAGLVLGIWSGTFGSSGWIKYLTLGLARNGRSGVISCRPLKKWLTLVSQYNTYGVPTLLYAPCSLVIVLSVITTVLLVRRRQRKLARNEAAFVMDQNRAIVQVSLIVASFLLGYLPEIVYRALYASLGHSRTWDIYAFDSARFICLRISECLNPIFYNIASSSIRSATAELLQRIGSCGSTACRTTPTPVASNSVDS